MSALLQINDPGRKTRARRLTFNPRIVCPAGQPVFETPEGSACRCSIEKNTLSALRDPESLSTFCMGNYTMCTSWQTEKTWIEEGLHGDAADDQRGMIDGRRYREDLVEQQPELEVTHYEVPE